MPALALWLLLSYPLSAHATAPSGETWFSLITPHFHVHHTKPLENYARAFARALERALPRLERDLSWRAPTPVDIVVMDPSDSANGFASNFPNTHIEVYAVPYESDSELTYYTDWVDELATHELTHIVANDAATGFYKPLRWLFGSWVKPNGLQPVWLIEGLAVYEETRQTTGGRGRAPWLEALLREAAHQNKLNDSSYITLDRFNDGNPWWPGGAAAYLLGYTIQATGAGEQANLPGAVSLESAGRVPFFPNTTVESVLGKSWDDVWADAETKLKARYAATAPLPAPCTLTDSGRATGGQALSPDGWIYYSEQDFHYGFNLARVRADAPCGSANVERLRLKWFGGPTQVAVNADGSLVAFSETETQRFERNFSDLYVYRPATGETTKITEGARARDPAFLGSVLYYVVQRADSTEAILAQNLQTGRKKRVWSARPFERIAGLAAHGDLLAFSLHTNDGREKIQLLSVRGGPPRPLTSGNGFREFERNPSFLPNGDVLYAHAFRDHQEIRRWRFATETAEIVAQGSAGFLDRPLALPSEKELLVSAYTLSGLNLARVPLDPGAAPIAPPEEDLHEYLSGEAPPRRDESAEAAETPLPESVPYNALHTPATSLWPQYWLPVASIEPQGFLIGATTTGNDPLNYHSYGLLAQYDSRANFPRYRAFYNNRVSTTEFQFEANQSNNYFASTKTSNRTAVYSAQASIPLGGYSFFDVGGAFQDRTFFRQSTHSGFIFTSYRYGKAGTRPAAMAPNFGSYLRAYAALHPNTPNEAPFVDLRPEAGVYFRGFLPSHSISITAHAGISTNTLLASNYYQGGGLSILSDSTLVVRGYPVDALLGQRVATANFAYTLPFAEPYHGWGLRPFFLQDLGLRFLADVGSANYVASYADGAFRFYVPQSLGKTILAGFGTELAASGTIFYHVPVSASLGVHYGPQKSYGGDLRFFLGLNIGLLSQLSGGLSRD